LDQHLDTSTPSGELHFHMLAAIAQFDYRLRRLRQMEGIAAAKARGVRCGPTHTLSHEQLATLVQRRQEGVLIRTLMAEYRLSKASIYRYLAQARTPNGAAPPAETTD
jgi:DNA invertase Pin-like site-specific DNA recombinase